MRYGLVLYHFASGHAYFGGLLLLVLAVALAWSERGRRAVPVLAACGVLLAAASATPAPYAVSLLLAAAVAIWATAEIAKRRFSPRFRSAARLGLPAACAVAAGVELPYHAAPRLSPATAPALAVIGDSITAGLGEDATVTWPRLVAAEHGVVVRDFSRMGATVTSASEQASRLRPDDSIVIVEIGGNDLLGGRTAAEFEAGLDALLGRVARPGRTVVLLELPLPPGSAAFGRAQRRLARRHGAVLVPKRVLMGVLAKPDSTVDSIHLSAVGHERMARAMWRVVGGAFE